MSWQILLRYDGIKAFDFRDQVDTSMGSPGSSTFESITLDSTSARYKNSIGHSEGLYNAWFNMTDISRVAFVNGSSSSTNPILHSQYLIYDLVETTGIKSTNTVLQDLNTFQKNNSNLHDNDNFATQPSVVNHTASFSGLLVDSSGEDFHINTNTGILPDKFTFMGINRGANNDIQALCAYAGTLQPSDYYSDFTQAVPGQTKGTGWSSNSPSETFWSYWGSDFDFNSETERIGLLRTTTPGVAEVPDVTEVTMSDSDMYNGPVYLMAYGQMPTIDISSASASLTTLQIDQSMANITYTASEDVIEWSVSPQLPSGLSISSSGTITGTPTIVQPKRDYRISGLGTSGLLGYYTQQFRVIDTTISSAIDNSITVDTIDTLLELDISTTTIQAINTKTVMNNVSVSVSDIIDKTAPNLNNKRRSVFKAVFQASQNAAVNKFKVSKDEVGLNITKPTVIVAKPNTAVNLKDIETTEAVYVPIYEPGETATFTDVGGVDQTVIITVVDNTDNNTSYTATLDGLPTNVTYYDNESYVIAGAQFIFGSVTTEGDIDGNICFMEGEKVLLRSQWINIEDIKPGDTLNSGYTVKHVIRTLCCDDMVLIKRGAVEENLPFKDTYITKHHKLFYHNRLLTAESIINGTDIIIHSLKQPVRVYNILLESYDFMCVNGIHVETLHPNNVNAQMRDTEYKIKLY